MKNFIRWLFEPFYFKTLLPYLGAAGFILYGGKGGDSDPPDFTALAQASLESAKLGKELGDAQLAENKRQYDQNYAVSSQVTAAQLGLMGQTKEQGDDYFSYMQQYSRPVEKQLFYEAMGFTADEVEQIELSRSTETAAVKAANATSAANAAAAAKPTTINVPTSNVKTVLPEGAIKGSDITGGFRTEGAQRPTVTMGNAATYGLTLKQWEASQKPDANGYYVKTAEGTYRAVNPTYETVNGTQTVTLPGQTAQAATDNVIDTPETNALVAKLGITAKERLAALDKTERDAILAKNGELETRIGETDTQVYNRYKDDIEAEAGMAVADSRAGFTNAVNVAARQGLRYGFSPAKLAAMANGQSVQQAGAQAAAANQTRKAATTTMYGRGATAAQTGLSGLTNNRNLRIQDEAIATAKKQDVAGLYRGLPGASQGAYGLAVNAGNSAVQNQNSTSAQYLNGMNQANQLIMQGQGQKVSGLSSMVGAQTSAYNAGQSDSGSAIWGALGTVGGAFLGGPAGAAIGSKIASSISSDENIKKDVKPVSDIVVLEGIKKTPISRWKYDPDKVQDAELVEDDKEHIGAMAQDVQKNLGSNVSNGKEIDVISALGVTMSGIKALAKKVEKLEGKNK